MQSNATDQKQTMTAQSADEMLTRIRLELVGIHAAIDARASDDREIVPWTKGELLTLIREIRSFQHMRKAAS